MATLLQINKTLADGPHTLQHLYDTIIANGNKIAAEYLEDGEVQYITYAQYGKKVRNCASHLQSILGKHRIGSFVGLRWDTNPEYPTVVWALLMAGYKPVLIDFRTTGSALAHILRQSGATAVITPDELGLPQGILRVAPSAVLKNNMALYFEEKWADHMALCTSGTTASSRVFVYDGAAIIGQPIDGSAIIKAKEDFIYDGDIKVLAYLPLHHIFGFMALMVHFSVYGKVLVYPKDRSASTTMEACRIHGVTHIFNVPLFWNSINQGIWRKAQMSGQTKKLRLLIRVSLWMQRFAPKFTRKVLADFLAKNIQMNLLGNKIRCLISGGGRVLPEAARTLNGLGYNLIIGYGMTELGITGVQLSDKIKKKLSLCCGEALPSVEYRIVPSDPEQPDIGELFIRSKTMHIGRMEEGKIVSPALDDDGWFTTGDIGRIEDRSLWIEGRLKEVIVNESGENVYPDELEDAFVNLPHTEQMCVLGLADGKGYEDISIVLEARGTLTDPVKLAELCQALQEGNGPLPVYKKLRRVYLSLQPLPLANGIKVQRQKLKKAIESGNWPCAELNLQTCELTVRNNTGILWREISQESDAPEMHPENNAVLKTGESNEQEGITPQAVAAEAFAREYSEEFSRLLGAVKEIFSKELSLPVEAIGDSSHFVYDLGGDSLSSLGVFTKIEELFGLTISDEEFMSCNCACDVAALIEKKEAEKNNTPDILSAAGEQPPPSGEKRLQKPAVFFDSYDASLQRNINQFVVEAESRGFLTSGRSSPEIALFCQNEEQMRDRQLLLAQKGFLVATGEREGSPCLVFRLSVNHTFEQIDDVLSALEEGTKELNPDR